MRPAMTGYVSATRHPWPCFLFLAPLLGAYEGGVLWLGEGRPEVVRNGADTWLHWGLAALGLREQYWGPALVAAVFLAWSLLRRWDRPGDVLSVCWGMAFESFAFAAALWGMSRGIEPFLKNLGVLGPTPRPVDPRLAQAVTFVGAGVYEEVLFRLVLFSLLLALTRRIGVGTVAGFVLAAVGSALAFAGAHHAGPYGEPFQTPVFVFRALAGVYFAILYQLRGFGIAVGAHACYDVLAGLVMV